MVSDVSNFKGIFPRLYLTVAQSPEQFSSPDLRILRSKREQLCKFVFMDKVSIYFGQITVPSLLYVGGALQRKRT